MRAWVFDSVHAPLREADVPVPVPGEGQVLVQVKACGLCHSDVGYLEGAIPTSIPFPFILGHEAAGEIAALGEGVTGWDVGDRVVPAISVDDCPGVTRDGAYAEYFLATASRLVRIPPAMRWSHAATATDAGLTSYTSVVEFGEVTAGDRLGVVGLGGLGMTGAQIAVALGATVIGVEPKRELWPTAAEFGVSQLHADVSELEGQDLDVIIDFAGFGSTTTGAIRAVKPRGRVVLVGAGRPEFTFNSIDLIQRAVELRGASTSGERSHLEAVLELMAAGKVSTRAEEIGFEDIPAGLGRLARGEANGRQVATFGN